MTGSTPDTQTQLIPTRRRGVQARLQGRGRITRFALVPAVAAVLSLGIASSAPAAMTIGQLAPGDPPGANCNVGPLDLFNTDAAYVVPIPGVITSWTHNAGAGAGQTLKMKVFRSIGGLDYRVVAHDGPRAITPQGTDGNTFEVNIPVQAGDFLGLNTQNAPTNPNACDFFAPGASRFLFDGDLADGDSGAFEPDSSLYNTNVSARLEPSRCGGENATIGGTNAADTIEGTTGDDVIAALGGRDVVRGLRGKDIVCGGRGNDKLKGGGGKDKLKGGTGRDRLIGGAGRDKCVGGKGDDVAKKCDVEKSI